MSEFEEGADLMLEAIVSLHQANHADIPGMLIKLAREYRADGIKSFLPPVDEPTCQIIIFPNSPSDKAT